MLLQRKFMRDIKIFLCGWEVFLQHLVKCRHNKASTLYTATLHSPELELMAGLQNKASISQTQPPHPTASCSAPLPSRETAWSGDRRSRLTLQTAASRLVSEHVMENLTI